MNDLRETRRKNLVLLIERAEGPTNLAKKLGHKGPSYVSQLSKGKRPIHEETAREFETKLKLPLGSMDKKWDIEFINPDQGTNLDKRAEGDRRDLNAMVGHNSLVSNVVQAVGAELEAANIELASSAKFAAFIGIVYEHAQLKGGIDTEYIRKIVELIRTH